MNIMEPLSEELQDNQYYVALLDELVEENDIELKHRLQKADTYAQFINDQAGLLMDKTIDYIKSNEVSFVLASNIVVEQWKERMFN
ncbi:hypothetical protein MTsPCn5_08810 [Croceitalea sp. MTPC5]|jgi:hypothetical protein|uniref:Uncharacterized protein n=4 Tax=Flagellimonas TaxID=444459 RepID=A0A371JVG3_9FLAO|nr:MULTISPECIES: hypothetical protein [Allomuricauda]GMN05493.1 hypothetical protein MTsPCn5_08810 [Croceitalea sp. MTPC5]MBO0340735.1 hypothetical protein [Allomuricauda profundi]MBO6533977.1 hypothetical protein [Allomuricauda sp.]MBO6589676.1 hypothetical protein [Allomuricauda sp.]MBO6619391.1 hypothetical protein [Allomuricauda sp.]|tara:strand:+ start:19010 stop:19267 length:258 start_codon:yes stop_codon:yes gene_type:complete